jgi:hypothetical protein
MIRRTYSEDQLLLGVGHAKGSALRRSLAARCLSRRIVAHDELVLGVRPGCRRRHWVGIDDATARHLRAWKGQESCRLAAIWVPASPRQHSMRRAARASQAVENQRGLGSDVTRFRGLPVCPVAPINAPSGGSAAR